jgi:hypothetical protein
MQDPENGEFEQVSLLTAVVASAPMYRADTSEDRSPPSAPQTIRQICQPDVISSSDADMP